ncbi:siderophore ABC transporter substrate-binding protein [Microbacterium sp.]|uniref:siderophore ABC transporter substrate-binding protein n=1 Tax=Microbacterium sp. TaxID=51671 RepID=UPI003A83E2F1
MSPRLLRPSVAALTAATIATLAGCSTTTAASGDAATTPAERHVVVNDNHGEQTVTVPPARVVATDNRTIQTLDDWGVEIVAAPLDIFSPALSYAANPDVINLGTHGEPDLESVVAADPDLIVNGQRFAQFYSDFQTLVPDATIVELDPREGEPFAEELIRQTTALGEIFDQQEAAARLVADFEEQIVRAQAAYDDSDTVMAVITSGGDINYAAPVTGRTLGPVFEMLDLTPSLASDGSSNHQGDDISVEAIADSNPDWILVMDRDAAVAANTDEEYVPASDLIAGSEALQNVTAVAEGQVIYMPQDTYLNEGIQTYTEFLVSFAEALEG